MPGCGADYRAGPADGDRADGHDHPELTGTDARIGHPDQTGPEAVRQGRKLSAVRTWPDRQRVRRNLVKQGSHPKEVKVEAIYPANNVLDKHVVNKLIRHAERVDEPTHNATGSPANQG